MKYFLNIFFLTILFCLSCGPADTSQEVGDQNDGDVDHNAIETNDELSPQWADDAKLTIQSLGSSRVTLTWSQATDSTDIAAYLVYQDDVLIATLPSDVNAIQVGPLLPNETYVFKVEARDPSGNESGNGPSAELRLDDQEPPTFGESVSLTIQQVTATSISLEWTEAQDNIGVSEYHIYQDHELIGSVGAETRAFSVDSLSEGDD